MKGVDVWMMCSAESIAAYEERVELGEDYEGALDAPTASVMSRMTYLSNREKSYKPVGIGEMTHTLYAIRVKGDVDSITEAVNAITAKYTDHVKVAGAWWAATGIQFGMVQEYSMQDVTYPETTESEEMVDGVLTIVETTVEITEPMLLPSGITGTPIYPIRSDTWKLMPDVITVDPNTEAVTTTAATSNADLRDVNLAAGQAPRMFI
jgi:hypothetical protein